MTLRETLLVGQLPQGRVHIVVTLGNIIMRHQLQHAVRLRRISRDLLFQQLLGFHGAVGAHILRVEQIVHLAEGFVAGDDLVREFLGLSRFPAQNQSLKQGQRQIGLVVDLVRGRQLREGRR